CGSTTAVSATTVATVRLIQPNRQALLSKELAEAEARVQEAQGRFAEAREVERAASERDEASRQALAATYRDVDRARQALSEAQAEAAQLDGRLAALIETAAAT